MNSILQSAGLSPAAEEIVDSPVGLPIASDTSVGDISDRGAKPAIHTLSIKHTQSRMALAVTTMAIIAVIASLSLARVFFVPLLIGILASYALHPLVEWLQKKFRIPTPAGAAIVMLVLVGGASWIGYSLADQTTAMIDKLPDAARKLRRAMTAAPASVHSPLQNVQVAATELQRAADAMAQVSGGSSVGSPSPDAAPWLREYALAQSASLISVVAQTPIVLLMTYFLLASGDHFRRKLIKFVGPSLSRKKDVLLMLDEIDSQVQRYLLVTLVSNALVALLTWLAFALMDIPQAGVWGIFAGVMHFIPYLGPAVVALTSGIAIFVQSGEAVHAVAAGGATLLIGSIIGHIFVTWLQSRVSRVNTAVLFIALLFFGWLWGIAGLLLGAPLIAVIKVICEHIEPLQPAATFMGQ